MLYILLLFSSKEELFTTLHNGNHYICVCLCLRFIVWTLIFFYFKKKLHENNTYLVSLFKCAKLFGIIRKIV